MSPALDFLARRVASAPTFLANQILDNQIRHDLTDAALAERLGFAAKLLTRVRLCEAVWADRFAEDCWAVAWKFGMWLEALEDVCWPW